MAGLMMWLRFTVGISLSVMAGPLLAQDVADTSTDEKNDAAVEEILVSAQRRSERLLDVPLSMIALSGVKLFTEGQTSLQGIGEKSANVSLDFSAPISGSTSAPSVFIRGVGQTDFVPAVEPGVGIYLDGVYIARSVGALLDLTDVERVEILRGPQGTLFGRNTIGGAIHVISKAPSVEREVQVSAEYGSRDRFRSEMMFNPGLAGPTQLRFTASYRREDGFIEYPAGDKDLGHQDRLALRASLRHEFSTGGTLDLKVDYSRMRDGGAPNGLNFFDGSQGGLRFLYNQFVAPFLDVPGLGTGILFDDRWVKGRAINLGDDRYHSDADIWGGMLKVTLPTGVGEFVSLTAYRRVVSDFARDPDASPLNLVATFNEMRNWQWSQEFTVAGTAFDDRFDWFVGVYGLVEKARDDGGAEIVFDLDEFATDLAGNPNPFYRTPLSLTLDALATNESLAFFTDNQFHVTPKWSVHFGARYTVDWKKIVTIDKRLETGEIIVPDPNGQAKFTNFSPRLVLAYQLATDVNLYVSYTEGYKSGGFTQRNVFPVPAPQSFAEERVNTYEVGFAASVFEGRLQAKGSVFRSAYDDIQITIFNGPTPETHNAGKARIDGGELELNLVPVDRLRLDVSLGFLNARYRELRAGLPGGVNPIAIDNALVNAPKWSASVNASYEIELSQDTVLTLSTQLSHKGRHAKDAINTPALIEGGYTLLNAQAILDLAAPWPRLVLYGENISNADYIVAGVADVDSFGIAEATYNRPRTWGLRLVKSF